LASNIDVTPGQFAATYRPTANVVSAGTGIDPIALLAQWANETAWGVSWAGAPFNLGNIEFNGKVVLYPSLDAFAQACIAVFHQPQYAGVLAATNALDQLAAIVASPWSAGHYGGSLLGFYSPLEGFELTPEEHQRQINIEQGIQNVFNLLQNGVQGTQNVFNALTGQAGGVPLPDGSTANTKAQLDRMEAEIKAGGGGGGTEPAEPTKGTIHFPAVDVPLTLG